MVPASCVCGFQFDSLRQAGRALVRYFLPLLVFAGLVSFFNGFGWLARGAGQTLLLSGFK